MLVDCLTLWLSNHMLADHDVEAECRTSWRKCSPAPRGTWFVVANEVGLGIVPDNALGAAFSRRRRAAQPAVAAVADRVLFMVAGLPLQVK